MSGTESPDRSTFAVIGGFAGLIVTGAAALSFVFSAGDPGDRAHWMRVAIAGVIGTGVGAYLGVTRRQFILNCVARFAGPLAAIRRAFDLHRDRLRFVLRLYVAGLVIGAWAVFVILPDRRMHRIIDQLQSPNPAEVEMAVDELQVWDCDGISSLVEERNRMLFKLLHHRDVKVLGSALWAVRSIDTLDVKAVSALIEMLDHPDEDARRLAAFELGRISADASPAITTLIRHLDDPSDQVRYETAYTLGGLGPAAVAAVVNLAVLVSEKGSTTMAAITALGNIHSNPTVSIPALLQVYNWADTSHCKISSFALSQFGPQAAAAIPTLERELATGDLERRRLARYALWHIDPAGHPEPLIAPDEETAASDEDMSDVAAE